MGNVSESSWETAFRGDEFEAGSPFLCEKLIERFVTESLWETAFSDDKFVFGMATWNETDSLNSVWQSPKFNLPGSFHMKEEKIRKLSAISFGKISTFVSSRHPGKLSFLSSYAMRPSSLHFE